MVELCRKRAGCNQSVSLSRHWCVCGGAKSTVGSKASRKFGTQFFLQHPTLHSGLGCVSEFSQSERVTSAVWSQRLCVVACSHQEKGNFPQELWRSVKLFMAQLRQAWPSFFFCCCCQAEILWSQLVGAFFKGCPVPLKHCIMAVLFCLRSLTDDTFKSSGGQFRLKSSFHGKSFDFIAV